MVIYYKFHDDGKIQVNYAFTDLMVIRLIADGVIERPKNSVAAAKKVISQMTSGRSQEKVMIQKGQLLIAESPASLLGLIGLHWTDQSNWRYLASVFLSRRYEPGCDLLVNVPTSQLTDLIREQIFTLTVN